MRLTELNPRFIGAGGEGVFNADGTPVKERHGIGITFNCPCLKEECGKVAVFFENPLDGGDPIKKSHLWKRTGETFDILTLTPSILRIKEIKNQDGTTVYFNNCDWHGYITNGEIIKA